MIRYNFAHPETDQQCTQLKQRKSFNATSLADIRESCDAHYDDAEYTTPAPTTTEEWTHFPPETTEDYFSDAPK